MSTILPNIIEIAQSKGIKVLPLNSKGKGGIGNEYKATCPFCEDKKYHLQLNNEKNVFFCYRCSEGGGVLNFIEKLTGKSRREILKELYKDKGVKWKKRTYFHPALKIPQETLKSMGFIGNVNYYKRYKENPAKTINELNYIWKRYKEYKKELEKIETRIMLSIINKINRDLEKDLIFK